MVILSVVKSRKPAVSTVTPSTLTSADSSAWLAQSKVSRNWVPAPASPSGSRKEICRNSPFSPAQAHLAIQPVSICSMQAVTADTGVSPDSSSSPRDSPAPSYSSTVSPPAIRAVMPATSSGAATVSTVSPFRRHWASSVKSYTVSV